MMIDWESKVVTRERQDPWMDSRVERKLTIKDKGSKRSVQTSQSQ